MPPLDVSADTKSSRPVRADVTTTATAGGVLVAVTLRNDTAVAVRVRVENDLDGPVLPPRREGVPAAGWDNSGFTGVVPANARFGIGYACPTTDGDAADRTRPDPDRDSDSDTDPDPVSLEVLGPADGSDPSTPDRVAAAVRSLGRATPPADAVPVASTADHGTPAAGRWPRLHDESVESAPPSVPAPIAAWLDAVETRVRRAERLTDATADGAAAVIEECGGVDGAETLPEDLGRDLTALRTAGDRIEELAARATAADPEPVVSSLAVAADGGTSTADGGDSGAAARDAAEAGTHGSGRTQ